MSEGGREGGREEGREEGRKGGREGGEDASIDETQQQCPHPLMHTHCTPTHKHRHLEAIGRGRKLFGLRV